ncbi:hypothetical protein PTTG_03438 [Puccinia triticina 1-1 BBBD Race 1]|uniref:Uncharacterized protein n=2 Tax=Puccinia triticina TaxID=208348 RepID=A0A180GUI2_PUCT1|nr:uncharacterized protein PtA15_7A717 [Puccinia triticina]OAV96211.1 hypothetical protein PTTG_03438 [Puccinia triticina 1-1 BBBD Race 1]WAQ86988.1 hypothetical protein PtA15_7A717 [Puccinia triticina]WAR56848.1 hypothetical protein PtB15_7B699 [Puccinia triticina]
MDSGSNFLAEFDHLLGIPPPTVENSSVASNTLPDYASPSFDLDFWGSISNDHTQSFFTASLDPMTTLPGLQVDYQPGTTTGSQSTGLSQNNLAVFNSLSESLDPAPTQAAAPAKPESSTTSSKPRFLPPKGPRKQHRTGFRQLPGANGKIKRGRPSKKEYKLAGVEVDMYALKGITLHGPAKSLNEVKGGEAIARRSGVRRSSRKSKSSVSSDVKSKPAPGPSTFPTIPEEPLPEQVPSQSYSALQDMLFPPSAQPQGNSAFNYQLPNLADSQNSADLKFLSAVQAVNDEITLQNNAGIYSQHDLSQFTDLGFQPLAGYQSGYQPSTGFQSVPDMTQPPTGLLSYPDLVQPSTGYEPFIPDLSLSTGFQPLSDLPPLSGMQQLANINMQPQQQLQMNDFPALNPVDGSLPAGLLPVDPNSDFSLGTNWDSTLSSQSYSTASNAFGLDGNLLPTYPDSQYSTGGSYNPNVYNQSAYPSEFPNL